MIYRIVITSLPSAYTTDQLYDLPLFALQFSKQITLKSLQSAN